MNQTATESESWVQLTTFLDVHVEKWADGQRPEISEMSTGHSLVYTIATENGKKGTRDLYDLFIDTLKGVTNGKRREAIYERYKRVATPLANSIFKYVDQLHVDKGGLPSLKEAAKLVWNAPDWTPSGFKPQPKSPSAAAVAASQSVIQSVAMSSNRDAQSRTRALQILRQRQAQASQAAKDAVAKAVEAADTETPEADTFDQVLEDEFGDMTFEDMLAQLKMEEEGIDFEDSEDLSLGLQPTAVVAAAAAATTADDGTQPKKKVRSRGGKKGKKKR